MIIVLGRAEVDPARLAAVRAAATTMMRATWAESGCLSYSLAVEDEGEPGGDTGMGAGTERNAVVTIAERWESLDALRAHGATPHMRAFNQAIRGAIRGMDVKMYDAANERPVAF